MIQALIQRVQNYADALFAGFTKVGQDGRRIIYPWGFLIRGYVIASEEDERRLKKRFAVFVAVVPILMGAGFAIWGYLGSLGVGALIFVGYAIHVTRLTANMEPSGQGLSLIESYRAQARKHSPARLWSWTITGIFLGCFGIVASVLIPQNRAGFALLIGIGGFLAAFGGWMLALRSGAIPPVADSSPVGDSVVAEEVVTYVTGDVGPVRAWFITIFGLVFTGLGIFLFVIDSEERSTAAGITAMFGLIAAFGIAMLVLRYWDRHR